MKSEQINELLSALAKAQGELNGAKKDAKNPFFKSSYASLASVWDAVREPLAKNGLSVIQTTDEVEGVTYLVTLLGHASGQWIEGRLKLNPVKSDPQGLGSAISYARRYALQAIVGTYAEDDDGNMASHHPLTTALAPTINFPVEKTIKKVEKVDGTVTEAPGDYLVTWGRKYKGKTLKEIPQTDIRGFINYLAESASKGPLSAEAKEFIEKAESYLATVS